MKIYKISRNYVSCEVWVANINGERISVSTCRPKSGLSRIERHAVIRDYLLSIHGIKIGLL